MGPKSVYFAGFLKNFISAAVILDLSYYFSAQDSLPYCRVNVKLSRRLRLPRISRQSAHERGKDVSPTHRPPLTPWDTSTHFCQRLSRPLDHSTVGRIKSIANPNDLIGNRTQDLTDCSAVPQPTAPPRAAYSRAGTATVLYIRSLVCFWTIDGSRLSVTFVCLMWFWPCIVVNMWK